jgi:hypothetical protein
MWACFALMKSDLIGCSLSVGLGFFILEKLAIAAAAEVLDDKEEEDLETFEAELDEEWWEDECEPGLRREYSQTELAPAAKSDCTMANCSGIQRDPLWILLICDTCRPSDR